ncbi:hypothetical protein ACPPVW_18240 [Leifsonia sp. McL0607]|uniref:hypothetical protein n=1 Tax=Leifsonia sp. McL0607 TaxID=3415672 RepID=UPI003CF4C0E8
MHAALTDSSTKARWINPDHLTSLIPRTQQGEFAVELAVDFKLQGPPEDHWRLGETYANRAPAQAAWDPFVDYLVRTATTPHAHSCKPSELTIVPRRILAMTGGTA